MVVFDTLSRNSGMRERAHKVLFALMEHISPPPEGRDLQVGTSFPLFDVRPKLPILNTTPAESACDRDAGQDAGSRLPCPAEWL